ncbi:DUF3019 domain-containing protein [Shewanella eurypsychrophilus]|uniref:DUF3019 domain-containing protein n=2 Tax=Shewanella eurypsychrophilus TaxID=2593656 RepID=A0ABX6V4X4_9GAMM|nr:DUF3019 domain-containing protein [Shewanella sp. YLB-09]QFU21556.1 DUF3019 domain-containing protein [Shewanella sp. YLB-09]QPG56846.1 DUF3019 domain-containing protein [Shewanella eurypsychrophilus]
MRVLNQVLVSILKLLPFGMLTLYLMSGLAVAADDVGAKLTLSPEFCITSEDELMCELTLVLEWENEDFRPICILSDYKEMAKWCAESADTQSLTLNIKATDDIQFVMIDKETHQTLAGVKLKVTPAAEPKVRRRYRNPWSLF